MLPNTRLFLQMLIFKIFLTFSDFYKLPIFTWPYQTYNLKYPHIIFSENQNGSEKMLVSTNINIDSELKKSAQELYSDLGLDLSTAVNLFLKQSLREQKIPFEIKRESEEEGFFDTLKSFSKKPEYSSFSDMVNSNNK